MNRYVLKGFTCSFTCPILFYCYSIKIFFTDFQSLTYFLVKKFKINLYNQKYGLPLYQQNETIIKNNCYENTIKPFREPIRRDYYHNLRSTDLLHRTIINP